MICLRILVFSDSHGRLDRMRAAVERQSEADVAVFLGDGANNLNDCRALLDGKEVYAVKGNNDFYCDFPLKQIITVNGVNIYICHGHYEYVKSGLGHLLSAARAADCQIALYGHTHVQKYDYIDGVHLFCPGALMSGNFGAVDVTDSGIMCLEMKL